MPAKKTAPKRESRESLVHQLRNDCRALIDEATLRFTDDEYEGITIADEIAGSLAEDYAARMGELEAEMEDEEE